MNKATNPFEFKQELSDTKSTRKLDYTPQLIALSNKRATELMISVSKNTELHELANNMVDNGNVQDLIDLIKAVYSDEDIKTDAEVLDGCDEQQLDRLLESRRSDRSKAKSKGLRQTYSACVTYISAMYAELLIRQKTGKPYQSVTATEAVDTTDMDAIKRRIKSLQTKTCRLRKLASYDKAAADELADTEAEIARLNGFRPNTRTTGKSVIGGTDVAELREVLKSVDTSKLDAAELERFNELVAKIG